VSHLAIRVDNLSKDYVISHRQRRHDGLRDVLGQILNSEVRWKLTNGRPPKEIFHALKEISLEINRGDVVGLIGRNGSGKSTLLKILSRITKPTSGRAWIHGRLASLLEVGTGFHPELTGRENIYLSGAIHGIRKCEIDRRLDEIIAFSGNEQFIDTPVKRYSSGMYVRLGFAVAAHLDPDILLVDEVLAVGDAQFQQKCLNKMQDVSKAGRTVLFVSHSMPSVTRLCPRAILLDGGKVLADGSAHHVVNTYMTEGVSATSVREWMDPATAPSGDAVRLRAVRVRTEEGRIRDAVDIRRPVAIEMEYEVLESGYTLLPSYDVFNEEGTLMFITVDLDPAWRRRARPVGRWTSTAWIPGNLLAEGRVFVAASMMTTHPDIPQFYERDAVAFQVIDSIDGDSARGDWAGPFDGVVRPLLKWGTHYQGEDEISAVG
jgi:lipopolysaccharide transport system ATP-binding protein